MIIICGGIAASMGLLLLALKLWWRVLDQIGLYKDLHAYIKEHKHEFFAWGREYRRKKGESE